MVRLQGQLIGLVLVNHYPEVPNTEMDFCLSEFFIMHKYRRNGYGREAARKAFDLHHGRWQLKCHPKNTASVFFWNSVVDAYTNGASTLIENYPDPEVDYDDGTSANVFFFEN